LGWGSHKLFVQAGLDPLILCTSASPSSKDYRYELSCPAKNLKFFEGMQHKRSPHNSMGYVDRVINYISAGVYCH
jgi:hypothetical protein